jgi:hypothetical protein
MLSGFGHAQGDEGDSDDKLMTEGRWGTTADQTRQWQPLSATWLARPSAFVSISSTRTTLAAYHRVQQARPAMMWQGW